MNAIDILDDSDINSEEEDDKIRDEGTTKMALFILKAIFAWKSFFKLSDAAVTYILASFAIILQMLANFSKSNQIRNLYEGFPSTLFKANRMLKYKKDDFVSYVVCPKCHELHDYNSCMAKINGTFFSYFIVMLRGRG